MIVPRTSTSFEQSINTDTFPVTVPGDYETGDAMLMSIAYNNGQNCTSPDGWTQIGTDVTQATLTSRLLIRTAAPGEAGTVYTMMMSGNTQASVVLMAWGGASGWGTPVPNNEALSTTHDAEALSGMAATSWAVNVWTEKSSVNTGWTNTTDDTQRAICVNTFSTGTSQLLGDSNGPVGGSGAWPTQTATGSRTAVGVSFSVELMAAADVASGSGSMVMAGM